MFYVTEEDLDQQVQLAVPGFSGVYRRGDLVNQFTAFTDASVLHAYHWLERYGWDIPEASSAWFGQEDLRRRFTEECDRQASAADAGTGSNRTSAGAVADAASGDTDEAAARALQEEADAALARQLQETQGEEDDAAMARRLQEDLYNTPAPGGNNGPDDVRAPIASHSEMLVDPDEAHFGYHEHMPAPIDNPFASDPRLGALYGAPEEYLTRVSLDHARAIGREEKRWILVDFQDPSVFKCLAINRDHWKDPEILALIQEHFVFLQYQKNVGPALTYAGRYFPTQAHEDPENYAIIHILDPRTGEKVVSFGGKNTGTEAEKREFKEGPLPDKKTFLAFLKNFLGQYSLDDDKKNPVDLAIRPKPVKDIADMSEEEMMEMAIRNSLPAVPETEHVDEEEEMAEDAEEEEQQPNEAAADEAGEPTAAAENEAFRAIATNRPHVEPANGPETTRIQFRHANGRIIRRFAANDPVRRIYEWLRASPLPGREGVDFQLMVAPEGHNLIEDLDKTIVEAGLKQATVMIEFL